MRYTDRQTDFEMSEIIRSIKREHTYLHFPTTMKEGSIRFHHHRHCHYLIWSNINLCEIIEPLLDLNSSMYSCECVNVNYCIHRLNISDINNVGFGCNMEYRGPKHAKLKWFRTDLIIVSKLDSKWLHQHACYPNESISGKYLARKKLNVKNAIRIETECLCRYAHIVCMRTCTVEPITNSFSREWTHDITINTNLL